jgi:predicted DNA binding CopG/RHH family protein
LASRSVKLESGRALDQKLIDKLSAEAERGYDLSKATRVFLREGRPARGEHGGESPRVASRIPEPVFRAAKRRAISEGLTVSEVIRALLAGYAAGHSSRAVAGLGRTRVTQCADSDLTATAANKRARRRRTSGARRTSSNSTAKP